MKNRNLMMCFLMGTSVLVSLYESRLRASLVLSTFGASTKELDTKKSLSRSKIPSKEKVSSSSTILPAFKLPEYTFFVLLILQAGCQPLLIKLFMPTTIVRTTAVLGQEGTKFLVSILLLVLSGTWREALSGWKISDSILAAGIPAGLYVVQNYCNLMANQVLPPMTFVVLNQTKTLSTAWCCFVLMGQRQSSVQVVALVLLVFSTLVVQTKIPLTQSINKATTNTGSHDYRRWEDMENSSKSCYEEEGLNDSLELLDEVETAPQRSVGIYTALSASQVSEGRNKEQYKYEEARRQMTMGVIPALCASFLSGLAGTFAQRTLQTQQRSPHLFNMELACFSVAFLFMTMAAGSPDCKQIKENGVNQGWTLKTWIPIISNGIGGILVGLVTKYQGAVVKSFAMIFGMAISGVLQQVILAKEGGGVTTEQLAGAAFGALSLYLHARYPP